jgi:hypothetical protein
MKETLQEFVKDHLPIPGLAAWGARLSDRSVISHCDTDWFVPAQIESILTRLTLAAGTLDGHGIQPVRVSWVFEHARIHLGVRKDGACLAFLLENRPGLSTTSLNRALDDFISSPSF